MQKETLELVKPAIEYGSAYLTMVDEVVQQEGEYPYNNADLAREDFAQFVRELEEEAQGIGLPDGFPPQQVYWLLKDGKQIVGEIRFRPVLPPPYEKFNGHVGYNIRPAQEGKGYATRQLALLMDEARRLNLSGISLTIEGDNPASVRVIEKNGGKLLQSIENPVKARIMVTDDDELRVVDVVQEGEKLDLYWIDL